MKSLMLPVVIQPYCRALDILNTTEIMKEEIKVQKVKVVHTKSS